jgi:phosphoribosylamine-glycine ligase
VAEKVKGDIVGKRKKNADRGVRKIVFEDLRYRKAVGKRAFASCNFFFGYRFID